MRSSWSLTQLFESLHHGIEQKLSTSRNTLGHPGSKGDSSERVWLQLLCEYLPARYEALKAYVVDSKNNFSEQIDIVVRDRQYSPFIFRFEGESIVPAESVYAVFEVKQSANLDNVRYAQKKAASVRRLHRTSLPIPHAGGTYPPKSPPPILAGLLTFDSGWSPPLGDSLEEALATDDPQRQLDLGCIAAHGTFSLSKCGQYTLAPSSKPATAFLLELIARLQEMATVPMIDIRAYASWIADGS